MKKLQKMNTFDKMTAVAKRQYFSDVSTPGGGQFNSKKTSPNFLKNKCPNKIEFFIKVPILSS